MDRALVTGVSGQDGIYLACRLRDEGVQVVGTVTPWNRSAGRLGAYLRGVELVPLDVRDAVALRALVARVEPDAVYNLAAVSSVGRSWDEPDVAHAVNATAVESLVDAVLEVQGRTGRPVRLFQASSAETGADAADSPYARAKAAAEDVVRTARAERDLHGCIARLYIHESPLRAPSFVSRKITQGVAAIATGRMDRLTLGNLDVVRDWGFAGDYVTAIHRLLQLDEPTDLSIGTGVPHSLAELVATAFAAAGLADHEQYVERDPALLRPSDTPYLVADPGRAERLLGWRATTRFEDLVAHMVTVDLARARDGVADDVRYLRP